MLQRGRLEINVIIFKIFVQIEKLNIESQMPKMIEDLYFGWCLGLEDPFLLRLAVHLSRGCHHQPRTSEEGRRSHLVDPVSRLDADGLCLGLGGH